jgi:hypothetical protein
MGLKLKTSLESLEQLDDGIVEIEVSDAIIAFDEATMEITDVLLQGDEIFEVLENADSLSTAIEQFGLTDGIALLANTNGDLDYILKLDDNEELELTDENREELSQAALEGLKETAKKVWDNIVAFFKMIWEKIKAFFAMVFNMFRSLDKKCQAEGKRLNSIEKANDFQQEKIKFSGVAIDGKKIVKLTDACKAINGKIENFVMLGEEATKAIDEALKSAEAGKDKKEALDKVLKDANVVLDTVKGGEGSENTGGEDVTLSDLGIGSVNDGVSLMKDASKLCQQINKMQKIQKGLDKAVKSAIKASTAAQKEAVKETGPEGKARVAAIKIASKSSQQAMSAALKMSKVGSTMAKLVVRKALEATGKIKEGK